MWRAPHTRSRYYSHFSDNANWHVGCVGIHLLRGSDAGPSPSLPWNREGRRESGTSLPKYFALATSGHMSDTKQQSTVEYRFARPEEFDALARLTALSFGEYPFFSFVFREAFDSYADYVNYMARLDRMHIRANARKHACLVGTRNARVVSVALLQDPTAKRLGVFDYSLSGGLGLIPHAGLTRLLDFFSISEQAHQDCARECPDAWYVEMLAVDSGLKGQGLGSHMIEECLVPYVRAHGGTELSLITNTEANRRFYSRNGFTEFAGGQLERKGTQIGNWSYRMDLE